MKHNRTTVWKKNGFEFLSIFIAVISAFALNNWNDNRRDNYSQNKILTEISNGLTKDLSDIQVNTKGHQTGLLAGKYFQNVLAGEKVQNDSLRIYYHYLFRDFVSIQNTAGYETLKSSGLEIIRNDSLREEIISLYEYEFSTLRKLEEEYVETQFFQTYFHKVNDLLSPHFIFNAKGEISGLKQPLRLQPQDQKKLLIYLWKIEINRNFNLRLYKDIEQKVIQLQSNIQEEIVR